MRSGGRHPAAGARVSTRALCALALGMAGASAACARALPPPGGPRDETPPAVLSITPEPGSTVAPNDEPVVIRFEERISEQGVQDAVYVTPVTGSLDITSGRSDIEVGVAGGWQPDRVYRVVVRPTVQDMFDNRLARPIEVVFSTGAPFSDAAVAGVVYERVSGSKLADVRVEAHPAGGGAYHLALSDTGGVFRMPLLPPGTYLLRAYADQNRDRRRDGYEAADSLTIEVGATDTLLRPLALMRPDSTAANVTRVQVVDSITLRVQFDDYMDVAEPQQLASVSVRALPDSAAVALAGIYYPHVLTAERARQDSIARDSARAAAVDSAGAPADTVAPPARVPTPPTPSRVDTLATDTIPPDSLTLRVREANLLPDPAEPLPVRELMVVLASPLVYEAEYVVQVSGILNLAGIPGGGGTATFRAPAAPPPPAPPAEDAVEPVGETADPDAAEADPAAPPEPEDATP